MVVEDKVADEDPSVEQTSHVASGLLLQAEVEAESGLLLQAEVEAESAVEYSVEPSVYDSQVEPSQVGHSQLAS